MVLRPKAGHIKKKKTRRRGLYERCIPDFSALSDGKGPPKEEKKNTDGWVDHPARLSKT